MPAVFNTRLLTDRNRVMAQRTDSLLRTGRTFLIAVGAAHLPGTDGLLAALRAKGYRVVPVPAVASAVTRRQVGLIEP
jgi:uncharacterized protein YbaP (TraB family)